MSYFFLANLWFIAYISLNFLNIIWWYTFQHWYCYFWFIWIFFQLFCFITLIFIICFCILLFFDLFIRANVSILCCFMLVAVGILIVCLHFLFVIFSTINIMPYFLFYKIRTFLRKHPQKHVHRLPSLYPNPSLFHKLPQLPHSNLHIPHILLHLPNFLT